LARWLNAVLRKLAIGRLPEAHGDGVVAKKTQDTGREKIREKANIRNGSSGEGQGERVAQERGERESGSAGRWGGSVRVRNGDEAMREPSAVQEGRVESRRAECKGWQLERSRRVNGAGGQLAFFENQVGHLGLNLGPGKVTSQLDEFSKQVSGFVKTARFEAL
jgi:hypothetical protein